MKSVWAQASGALAYNGPEAFAEFKRSASSTHASLVLHEENGSTLSLELLVVLNKRNSPLSFDKRYIKHVRVITKQHTIAAYLVLNGSILSAACLHFPKPHVMSVTAAYSHRSMVSRLELHPEAVLLPILVPAELARRNKVKDTQINISKDWEGGLWNIPTVNGELVMASCSFSYQEAQQQLEFLNLDHIDVNKYKKVLFFNKLSKQEKQRIKEDEAKLPLPINPTEVESSASMEEEDAALEALLMASSSKPTKRGRDEEEDSSREQTLRQRTADEVILEVTSMQPKCEAPPPDPQIKAAAKKPTGVDPDVFDKFRQSLAHALQNIHSDVE